MKLTKEDVKVLKKAYDKNGDGVLSEEEIEAIVADYKSGKVLREDVKIVLAKYDTNQDGDLDSGEVNELKEELTINETAVRYAGYSVSFARAFRYLAFTSDFGEALRPVVSARVVTGSYMVAIGYCITDIAWEAHKLKERGYKTEHNVPMSMAQCVVERTAFQAVASMIVPTIIIHSSVEVAKKAFAKLGKFQKWGPSIVGLSVIPLLPLYLDHPVEEALEWTFHNYGPWAKDKEKKHKD